ncbi:hypothetical protein OMAG_000849 [Candidatus Omnitrophus magneticus]|uniref:Uncharacterized protein n=1 Tax=Candidatus Omnitrophus magneticus TaxID=1609969 RepID=A0A0F0CTD7_9BACT|nr:hypothetical protein OMAG_000849 [Candidatus Omnitrophus magneticus]
MLSSPICHTRTVLSHDALVTIIFPVSFIIVLTCATSSICPDNILFTSSIPPSPIYSHLADTGSQLASIIFSLD